MLRQYVVIPVYWGQSFLPNQHGSFSWLDMNGAILTIMNGPYMDALQEYGVGHSLFHPTADVAPGELAVGTHFTNAQIESLLVSEIDAGRAPRPDVFDQGVIPFYVVFLRQGLFSQDDPAAVGLHWTFTYQNVQSPCAWVMQGDNLDGTTPIFTHELAEATALQEVGDDCLGSQGRLDGIMVQGFFSKVQNACIIPTDGPRWHSWFRIGDPFPASVFDMITPVEAVIGPTKHLDLFSMGNDQGVWSNFWDGQWHSWFRIGDPAPASTFNLATPVEAVVGPTGHLDLFVVGNDGGVWSNFWDGQWHSWFRIGDPATFSTFDMRTPVAAVVGPTGHLDLFVMGNDLGVWSNFWDGQWHSWFRIGDPAPASTFNMATPVEAVIGPTNHLDLFVVGNDGGIWSSFWDGQWHSWFRIGDAFPASTFDIRTPVEAVVGPTGHLDLFVIGNDGGVWSNFWDGQWHSWFRVGDPFPASTFNMATPVEAVVGPTNHLDLFVMGNDLGVWSNFWDGQWHSWFRIGDPAPSSTFNMATPVEALVGPTNHLDLFAVGNDGGVWSNFWGN